MASLCSSRLQKSPSPGNHGYLRSGTVVWVCVFWLPAVKSDLRHSMGDHYRNTGGVVEKKKKSHRAAWPCRGLVSPTGNHGGGHKGGGRKKVSLRYIKTAGNFPNSSTCEPEPARTNPYRSQPWHRHSKTRHETDRKWGKPRNLGEQTNTIIVKEIGPDVGMLAAFLWFLAGIQMTKTDIQLQPAAG